MNIETLRTLLSPPVNPVDPGSKEAWSEIEDELGTALPDDYKRYIQTYGSGYIGDYILIWSPSDKMSFNLMQNVDRILKGLRGARERYKNELNEDYPLYPIFPEPGGILPFGSTIDGDIFFWKTQGLPDGWTIVLEENRSPITEEHPYGLGELLVRLIRKEIPETILYSEGIERWYFTPIKANNTN